MPVANVPQQAGLEGVGAGYNPAPLLFPNNVQQQREDGDEVRRPPIHVYVPQDHQEQQDHLQVDIEEHAPPAGRVPTPLPVPPVEEPEEEYAPPARRDGAVVVPPAEEEHVPPAGRVPAPLPVPPVEEAEEEYVPPAGRVHAPPPAPPAEEVEEEHVPPAGRVPVPLPVPPVEEPEEEHVPPAGGDGAVGVPLKEEVPTSPAEAIVPQEKVAQIALV